MAGFIPPVGMIHPPADISARAGSGPSGVNRNPWFSCSDLKALRSSWKLLFLLNIWMTSLKFRQVV